MAGDPDDDFDTAPRSQPQPRRSSQADAVPAPRPRTDPYGIPVIRRAQRMPTVDPPEDDDSGPHAAVPPPDELGARIDMHLRRAFRGPRKMIATALIAALGSLGGLIVWGLNSREQAGDEKARLRYLERAVDRLTERVESLIYRSPGPWRRDEPDSDHAPATPRKEPIP